MKKKQNIKLEPLKISCNNADCGNNLHCFRRSKREVIKDPSGTCIYCGAGLIKWDRIHQKLSSDFNYTLQSLKKEWVRHFFWHIEIPVKASDYALRKGMIELKNTISKRIIQSIGNEHPYHDGYQTPFKSDNPIHYAQHATATCCRKCVEYWHGIEQNRKLTSPEINYLSELILRYLQERIVGLTDERQKISSIKKKDS